MNSTAPRPEKRPFSRYQSLLVLSLGFLLFGMALDFMLMPALSAMVLESMALSTEAFALILSLNSLAAGISAFALSLFADRIERKKLLLITYALFCGGLIGSALAPDYHTLIAARLATGISGGMIAALCFTLISEHFEEKQKGRAMGLIQIPFGIGQLAGLPLALYLAAEFQWQYAYAALALVAILAFFLALSLIGRSEVTQSPDSHFWQNWLAVFKAKKQQYCLANNFLLITADVAFMSFSSAYFIFNQGLEEADLASVFGLAGVSSLAFGPLFGFWADRFGQGKIFSLSTLLGALVLIPLSLLSDLGLNWILVLNSLLFCSVAGRTVSAGALSLMVPRPENRASFLSIDSALQRVAAGFGAALAGWILVQSENNRMLNYPQLLLLILIIYGLSTWLFFIIQRRLKSEF